VSKNNLTFILFELLDNGLKFSTQDKKSNYWRIVYSEDYYQIDIFDSELGLKGRAKINRWWHSTV
jgi:hypothetical protein